MFSKTILLLLVVCFVNFGDFYAVRNSNQYYQYDKDQDDVGNYQFSFAVYPTEYYAEQTREESGNVVQSKYGPEPATVVRGSYSYIEGGYRYTVNYEADEDGYRAQVHQELLPQHGAVTNPDIGTACLQSLQGCSIG